MDESTTLQGMLADINGTLDLPHGPMPAVQLAQFAHGWRVTGPGFSTNSGMTEVQAQSFLAGMLAALDVAARRDRA